MALLRSCVSSINELTPDPNAALIVPVFEDAAPNWALLEPQSRTAAERLVTRGVITGKAQEAVFIASEGPYGGVIAVGVGKMESLTPEVARRAAGKAVALLQQHRISAAILDVSNVPALDAAAFLTGLALGQYRFDAYKEKDETAPPLLDALTVVAGDDVDRAALLNACEQAAIAADCTNWARDLANAPSNDLTPTVLAERAEAMAKELGCASTVLHEDELLKLNMHLLLAVARGSDERATLTVLHYTHPDAKKTVALVGKGITFDTGGISIKPGQGMHEMKYDMCGAAAVLGAFRAIAQLKPAINVLAVVPAAENMPGPAAVTPGEIVTGYNGKTVEVHNTDAEGRMILADALAYTADVYKPDAMVDAATLTGAAIIALGHYAAAILGTDEALQHALSQAACKSGDNIWPLPLWDDYVAQIKGTHGDLCNIGPAREAGTIMGAAFLKHFVGDIPWAHVDIAGTAWGAKNIAYLNPDHASGFGVRLFTQWVLNEAGA